MPPSSLHPEPIFPAFRGQSEYLCPDYPLARGVSLLEREQKRIGRHHFDPLEWGPYS